MTDTIPTTTYTLADTPDFGVTVTRDGEFGTVIIGYHHGTEAGAFELSADEALELGHLVLLAAVSHETPTAIAKVATR